MHFPRWKYNTSIAGIVYLHLTLWTALITFTLSLYTLAHGRGDDVLVPCAVLLLMGSLSSFAYISFHEYHAHKRIRLIQTKEVFSTIRRPVYMATRLSIALAMLWLLSVGWNMIIAARQPICMSSSPTLRTWQAGGACKAQRAGTAFALISLITVFALFTHMATTRDPFDIHLLGRFKDRPVTLNPYRFSRNSKDMPSLVHKISANSEKSWSEKPLPRTPSTKSRPSTPRPTTPTTDAVGLGIFTSPHLSLQEPPISPSRPASIYGSPRSSSVYTRTPPIYHSWQMNNSTTVLKGFMPLKELRPPAPAATADSAWRALHPPATHFRHVSSLSPQLRPFTSQGLSSIRTVPNSPLLHSAASRSPSQQSSGQSRGHRRNKSAPYTPISIPPSVSQSSSSISSPRRRGHVRCTSDPNEMISAHLDAEMNLATRLDLKLREVSLKLEKQRFMEKRSEGSTSESSANAGKSESAASRSDTAETEMSLHTARSGNVDEEKEGFDGRAFARMEWDVLMGKEVII